MEYNNQKIDRIELNDPDNNIYQFNNCDIGTLIITLPNSYVILNNSTVKKVEGAEAHSSINMWPGVDIPGYMAITDDIYNLKEGRIVNNSIKHEGTIESSYPHSSFKEWVQVDADVIAVDYPLVKNGKLIGTGLGYNQVIDLRKRVKCVDISLAIKGKLPLINAEKIIVHNFPTEFHPLQTGDIYLGNKLYHSVNIPFYEDKEINVVDTRGKPLHLVNCRGETLHVSNAYYIYMTDCKYDRIISETKVFSLIIKSSVTEDRGDNFYHDRNCRNNEDRGDNFYHDRNYVGPLYFQKYANNRGVRGPFPSIKIDVNFEEHFIIESDYIVEFERPLPSTQIYDCPNFPKEIVNKRINYLTVYDDQDLSEFEIYELKLMNKHKDIKVTGKFNTVQTYTDYDAGCEDIKSLGNIFNSEKHYNWITHDPEEIKGSKLVCSANTVNVEGTQNIEIWDSEEVNIEKDVKEMILKNVGSLIFRATGFELSAKSIRSAVISSRKGAYSLNIDCDEIQGRGIIPVSVPEYKEIKAKDVKKYIKDSRTYFNRHKSNRK